MPHTNRPPTYRLHKARQCAVVTINGKNHYLGPYGSPESYEKYARLLAEWQSNGKHLLEKENHPVNGDLSVNELILRYVKFASGYYVKNGKPTGEFDNLRCALRSLKKLYGSTPAAQFGPKNLELVRQSMIEDGLARKTINGRVSRIRRAFRWASREGLVPAGTYHGLTALEGLKRGRSAARERPPVTTVPEEHVQAVLPCVNPYIRAMIQVQELAGMRPQDIRNLRTSDLDMARDVWIYTPWTHKTEHHGHVRRIAIGPKAQTILRPFLKPENSSAYVFSPKEAVDALRKERATRRKTRRTPSELKRKRRANPKRQPRSQYDKNAYERAVERGCVRAGVFLWTPNQLRHNCGTKVRRLYGLDAAAAVLGHRLGTVTEVYAEADLQKAIDIMREIG
jgi:integrase